MSTYLLRLAQRGAGLDPVRVQPPFRPTFLPDTGHAGSATEATPGATAPPEPQASDALPVSRIVPVEGSPAPLPPTPAVPGPLPDARPAESPEPARNAATGLAAEEGSPRRSAESVRPLLSGEPIALPATPVHTRPAEVLTGDASGTISGATMEAGPAAASPASPAPLKAQASKVPLSASKPVGPTLGDVTHVQPAIPHPRMLPVPVATPAPEAPHTLPAAPALIAARSAPTAAPVPVEVRIGTVEVRAEKPIPPPAPPPAPRPHGFEAYARLRHYERWS